MWDINIFGSEGPFNLRADVAEIYLIKMVQYLSAGTMPEATETKISIDSCIIDLILGLN